MSGVAAGPRNEQGLRLRLAEYRHGACRTEREQEQELNLSLGEARLQHEEERTRLMEELNGRAEKELRLLKEEQEEAARRHLASESKRVATEELTRVSREMTEVQGLCRELEAEGAHAKELRERLTKNADAALVAEVERLSAEVRALKSGAKSMRRDSNTSGAPDPGSAKRPPKAKPAAGRTPSRGRARP